MKDSSEELNKNKLILTRKKNKEYKRTILKQNKQRNDEETRESTIIEAVTPFQIFSEKYAINEENIQRNTMKRKRTQPINAKQLKKSKT